MHKCKNGNDGKNGYHEILRNILSKSCPTDCYLFLTNRTFGCFPYPRNEIQLEFEYHIRNIGYKFCENSINFTERMNAFLVNKCLLDICSPNCENIYFKTKFNTITGKLNQTVLELYPIKSKHFEYIETLNTDFNQFIYNCGGIMSLWFGLSPISIADLAISLISS
jgi:hypothetical protein